MMGGSKSIFKSVPINGCATSGGFGDRHTISAYVEAYQPSNRMCFVSTLEENGRGAKLRKSEKITVSVHPYDQAMQRGG